MNLLLKYVIMKKVILIFISAFLICTIVNAQYKINKTKYDYHTYTYQVGDRYSTGVAGITSFLIPGLGQMLSGEVGRGAGFLVLDYSSVYVVTSLLMECHTNHKCSFTGNLQPYPRTTAEEVCFRCSWHGYNCICSIADAVRCRKSK